MKIKLTRIFFLLVPIFLTLLVSPLVFVCGFVANFVTIPIYLGLLTWPAYIYVLYLKDLHGVSLVKCWWIRISLIVDILCSIYGVFMGYMLPILSPLALGTLLICLWLLFNFEKRRKLSVQKIRQENSK